LYLKTDSSGLVIWVSKSPQRFFGLVLKIKQASVVDKNDRGRMMQDTHQDLAEGG
jgi:hypothetical protein